MFTQIKSNKLMKYLSEMKIFIAVCFIDRDKIKEVKILCYIPALPKDSFVYKSRIVRVLVYIFCHQLLRTTDFFNKFCNLFQNCSHVRLRKL